MSESIKKTLLALKDVQGTQGSFVLNSDGALLAMEMPAMFDVPMFTDLGPRIERLAESFSALGDELESCLVRFADHLLCIKFFAKGGALCILTDNSVNQAALKMAMNLAHRRIATEMSLAQPLPTKNGHALETPAQLAASPAPLPEVAAPPPPPPPEQIIVQAPQRRSVRMYRGQIIED